MGQVFRRIEPTEIHGAKLVILFNHLEHGRPALNHLELFTAAVAGGDRHRMILVEQVEIDDSVDQAAPSRFAGQGKQVHFLFQLGALNVIAGQPGFQARNVFSRQPFLFFQDPLEIFGDPFADRPVAGMGLQKVAVKAEKGLVRCPVFQEPGKPFPVGGLEPGMSPQLAELGLEQVLETGSEKRFVEDGLEAGLLTSGAVDRGFDGAAFHEQKTVNDEFKIEMVPPLDNGLGGENIMMRQGPVLAGEILDQSRRTSKNNGRKSVHLQHPEIMSPDDFCGCGAGHDVKAPPGDG